MIPFFCPTLSRFIHVLPRLSSLNLHSTSQTPKQKFSLHSEAPYPARFSLYTRSSHFQSVYILLCFQENSCLDDFVGCFPSYAVVQRRSRSPTLGVEVMWVFRPPCFQLQFFPFTSVFRSSLTWPLDADITQTLQLQVTRPEPWDSPFLLLHHPTWSLRCKQRHRCQRSRGEQGNGRHDDCPGACWVMLYANGDILSRIFSWRRSNVILSSHRFRPPSYPYSKSLPSSFRPILIYISLYNIRNPIWRMRNNV